LVSKEIIPIIIFYANYWAFYWIDPNTGNLNWASSYFHSKFHKSGDQSDNQNSARWPKKLFNNHETSSSKKFGAPNCRFGQSVNDKERIALFSNLRLLWLKAYLSTECTNNCDLHCILYLSLILWLKCFGNRVKA